MTAGLEGKVAVVTGGGSGLGEAIARRLAADGCMVVVAGRRRGPIEAVAAAIGGLAVATQRPGGALLHLLRSSGTLK